MVALAVEILHVHDGPLRIRKVDRDEIRKMQQDQVSDALLSKGMEREIGERPATEHLTGAELEYFAPVPLG